MSPSRRLLWWSASAVGVAGWFLFAAWTPSPGDPVVCLFRRSLELPCPGCGMTRALGHLARGELGAAMAFHPLSPWILFQVVVAWLAAGLWAHRLLPERARGFLLRRPERWLLGTAALLLAVWLGRIAVGDLSALG